MPRMMDTFRPLSALLLTGACLVLACGPSWAQSSDTEARLREALRASTAQVRALEDERAMLQARMAEADRERESLRQQLAALQQQEKPAKPAVDEEALADFQQRLDQQNAALGQMGAALNKWRSAYEEAANVARAKEAERAQLAARVPEMTARLSTCETKNVELYKVGNEILTHYAEMDIGDVMAAREPFLGFKRVELQNLVQDYQDKLLDQKVTP